jgi:hypothetical protein
LAMIVVSRHRLSLRVATFNAKFNDRPLRKNKEESDALMAEMFSEILGRRVEAKH